MSARDSLFSSPQELPDAPAQYDIEARLVSKLAAATAISRQCRTTAQPRTIVNSAMRESYVPSKPPVRPGAEDFRLIRSKGV